MLSYIEKITMELSLEELMTEIGVSHSVKLDLNHSNMLSARLSAFRGRR